MSGTMDEIITIPRAFYIVARGAVYFPPCNRSAGRDGFDNGLFACITSMPHHSEPLTQLLRRFLADETCPRNVVIHRAGCLFLPPDVEQNEVTRANRGRTFRAWAVMGIGAVSIYSHNGRIGRNDVFPFERLQNPLLNGMFRGAAIADACANFLKSGRRDCINGIPCSKMRFNLFVSEC